jgi:two-component system sensor histidine kinase GlrK
MRIPRPRTLLGMVLMGLAFVTVPLLVAVGNAMFELGDLAEESRVVLDHSATATREGQRLPNLLTSMERTAGQYLLQDDPASAAEFLRFYDNDQASFEASVTALRALPNDEAVAVELARLMAMSREMHRALRAPNPTGIDSVLDSGFGALRETARAVADPISEAIGARLETLQESTRTAQRELVWLTAGLIPGALVLVGLFLLLVGRPLRQIDRAIRDLGEGDFTRPITVSGPNDIETLGLKLEWLRHRLKESTDEKNKFLRHMSHELKTPLANIREGTELLLDGSVGALDIQQQEVTGLVRDNSVKLQKLIENLLTFSAWQTHTAALELTEFDLKPMVFGVLAQHRLAIANKKVKLKLAVAAISVVADEGKLKLVLENLLSNAIKFTPSGGTISVGAGMQGSDFVMDVSDDGPGVHPDDADRIFEAFYQGRRPQGGPVGGTGIGLSVVAECIQAHGGSVELKRDGKPGAHFQVRLPLRRAADKRLRAVANA